ncbi:hypothetical protein [Gordonia crocea]|uniref:Secreted protein n=1 Tax=Gordonia crocea TaxID=589162 RepID=A0A7I9V1Z4_9ACTN|nr:hypothetical protein [Gordonia crocea]GED99173.1 hypothetical protein nbrc107697_32120 [Gordonia crocea]
MARVRIGLLPLGAATLAATSTLLVSTTAAAAPPEVGQPCAGAEIGRKVTDSKGRTIMCNNYRWQIYQGQRPSHPWADNQR